MSRGIFSYFGLFLSQPRWDWVLNRHRDVGSMGCWGVLAGAGERRPELACKMRKSELWKQTFPSNAKFPFLSSLVPALA